MASASACSAMPPYMGGGEMIADVSEDRVTYAEPPHRFEAGTPPIVQAIGLGAALTYMESARPPAHPCPRGGAGRLCPGAPVAHQQPDHLRAGHGQGRHRLLQHGRRPPARRLDHHRPVGRRGAGPAPTAPSRCLPASVSPPPVAPPSRSITPPRKSTAWPKPCRKRQVSSRDDDGRASHIHAV